MGVLGRVLRATVGESLHPSNPASAGLFGLASTRTQRAGEVNNRPELALTVSAVYSAVSLIAETIGAFPAYLYRKQGAFRERADELPIAELIAEAPNEELDASELWRQTVGWMLVRGNAYVHIETNGRGKPVALWPIPATAVAPARTRKGRLVYAVNLTDLDYAGDRMPRGREVVLFPHELMHFRAFGLGAVGLSPIAQEAEAVALALNAEEYGGRFFEQGARPGGVITTEKRLSDDDFERMRNRWERMHKGVRKSHLIAILENGAKWESTGMSNDDMQLIELRRFQVADVIRVFHVPPHLVGDVTGSTSWGTGIEQQNIGLQQFGLLPWTNRLERVVRRWLLKPFSDTSDVYARWNMNGLLRGDFKTRMEGYAIGRQWGLLNGNRIAALEDWDPIPGGDSYLVPLNMGVLQPDGSIDGGSTDQAAGRALLDLLQRAAEAARTSEPE